LDIQTALITAELKAQKTSLETKLTAQTASINAALTNFTNSVASSIASLQIAANDSTSAADRLEVAASLSQTAAEDLQAIGRRQAASLLIPQSVVTGENVTLRYRGYSAGLIPLIDVISSENVAIIQATPMIPLANNPSIYEIVLLDIEADVYEPGTLFTVIVTESTTGSIESGAVFIEAAKGQLLMPGTVLIGDKLNIRFRGRPDWKPLIKIVDFENNIIVDNEKMSAVRDETDLFEYTVLEVTSVVYKPGKPITVVIIEEATSATETGTILVESTSLSSLEGLVAAGAGTKSIIKDTLEAINVVKGNLATGGDISLALEEIKLRMRNLPKELADEQITVPIIAAVDEIREQFMQFTGEEGYDFRTLLETGLEESSTIADLRNSSDEMVGATEVMQKIMEQKLGGEDAPIVHSFFH